MRAQDEEGSGGVREAWSHAKKLTPSDALARLPILVPAGSCDAG